MTGIHDRLIHNYMGVNYAIVWDIPKNKIPELTTQLEEVVGGQKN